MSHRESDLHATCITCRQITSSQCTRCKRPACDLHLYTDDQVCGPCQALYDQYLDRRGARPLSAPLVIQAVGVLVALLHAMKGAYVLGIAFGVVTILLASVLVQWRTRDRRRRFLDELRQRGAVR